MSSARKGSKPIRSLGVKMPNRRVIGGLMADGTITWRFRRLMPDGTIREERIRLSKEALIAMDAIAAMFESEAGAT
jgi:hypothetical protein